MKRLIALGTALFSFASAAPAFANLSRDAVTSLQVKLYGFYTTTDATCQTGLVATIPLSKTATLYDMAKSPTFGSGNVASPIGCAIMVMANDLAESWAAGTYTTTTSGLSDSVCNSGGSSSGSHICRSQALSWPAQIQTDAAAVGLNLPSACSSSGSSSEVIALYLSTYSACAGNVTNDTNAGRTQCINGTNSTNTAFVAPTASGDTANGINISTPTSSSHYTFVVDPNNMFGNRNGSCSDSPPLFSFR